MATAKQITAAYDTFIQYMHECNMRVTPERLLIMETVMKINKIFSIDQLQTYIENDGFPVSLATLYNTLDIMSDAGVLKIIKLPDRKYSLYQLSTADMSHIYLICSTCGTVKEISQKNLIKYIDSYEFPSFNTKSFTLNINGICRKCAKNNIKYKDKQ